MARDYVGASSFAQNFMQGFSFIDNAFASRRQERRLEERLAEEREQRKYQRELSEERRGQQRETFERQKEIWADQEELEAKQKEAEAIYTRGNMTEEEMRAYGKYDPRIQAELEKRIRRGEIKESIQNVMPQGGGLSGQAAVATGAATGQPEAPQSAPAAAADEAAAQAGTLFEPARGEANMQEIDAGDIRKYDTEYTGKGLGNKALDIAGGVFANAGEVIEDVVKAPFRGAEAITADIRGIERVTERGNVGANAGGNIIVPADVWTDDEEMAALSDPEEIQAAVERNQQLVIDYHNAARSPRNNDLKAATRHGELQQAGEQELNRARRFEATAVDEYTTMVNNPEKSPLLQMAAQDPAAASARYFETRETVRAANPDLAAAVDARMVPVLDRYSQQLATEASQASPGSMQQKRLLQRQAQVVASRNKIAGTQPSANKQAGVQGGLKIGHGPTNQAVADVAFGGNRPTPVPGTQPGTQANAALTVAGRINPGTKRLSDKQVDSLVTLVDYGLVDKATFMAVISTGSWPPGKDPNAIKQMMKAGDSHMALLTEGGAYQIVPLPGAKMQGEIPNQEIGMDKIDTILNGVGLAVGGRDKLTPEAQAAIGNMVIQNAGYIRANFAVSSEEQLLKLGQIFHQSYQLSQWNRTENYSSAWYSMKDNPEDAPSSRDLLMNPALRRQIAADYAQTEGKKVELYELPPRITEASDIDWGAARQSIANGDLAEYGIGPQYADKLTNNEIAYVIYVLNSTPEQIEQDAAAAR